MPTVLETMLIQWSIRDQYHLSSLLISSPEMSHPFITIKSNLITSTSGLLKIQPNLPNPSMKTLNTIESLIQHVSRKHRTKQSNTIIPE
ncbi:hypothetical protein GDO81_010012 [Engystomops pustulosus]|uniref:Uncharacterized protein n=1 Tax=Engystomops pustulosus TaxID=76066 RepID=A0AAV7BVY9_ENGPU|nr:hypothetical protein GDO81_010012 [Engystomops pustulosus]